MRSRLTLRRTLRLRPSLRGIFLSGLGGIFFLAFRSLRRQVLGLYGARGIVPVEAYLRRVHRYAGDARFGLVPTLFWFGASDRALVRACAAGQAVAALLVLGVAPRAALLALCGLYLSFVSVGQEFMSFQWDVLLLEAGVLALFAASPGPSRLGLLLLRWLVLRLYFESGAAKLQSGDLTWRRLSACSVYYETQPLPNRAGWYAHQLPELAQRASTAAVLALECVLPFAALGPRTLRRVAFGAFTALQAVFAGTGNYGFFNLLSAWLGLPLLLEPAPAPRSRLREGAEALLAAPLLWISTKELLRRFVPRALPVDAVEERLAPLRVANGYGLFSVMTTVRPEILLEGSQDGERWEEYGFRYKPGPVDRPPVQVAPHQPRLDWQLWFAALGSPPGWFSSLMARLLEGAPEVLALLGHNPFPQRPPRYARAVLYEYEMTSPQERARTGAWWRRARLGLYFPVVTLRRQGSPPDRPLLRREPARA